MEQEFSEENHAMKCLILAGGFATRLYPESDKQIKAKALLSYSGKSIIGHLVDKVPPAIPVMVATNKKFEASFLHWQTKLERKVTILIEEAQHENQKPGAVSAIDFWIQKKQITEDLWVIAGDNYFEGDLLEFHDSYDGRHSLVAVYDIGSKEKARQFGVVRLNGSRIIELQEKPTQPVSSLVATACYIFPPDVFPLLHQYCNQAKRDHLGSFISHLTNSETVHAYMLTKPWLDIGNLNQP
jgi:glucose-1-phosphate thymidylyltransferase